MIGATGFVDIPVTLRRTLTEGGLNYFTAVIDETDGRTTNLSNVIRVALTTLPPGSNASQPFSGQTLSLAPTPLAGDYDHNDVVDNRDYSVWQQTFGQTGVSLDADGNGDGTVDAGDYLVWRANIGQSQSDSPQPVVMTLASASIAPFQFADESISSNNKTDGSQVATNASTFTITEHPSAASSRNAAAMAFESLLSRPRALRSQRSILGRPLAGGDQIKALDLLIDQISSWRGNEGQEGRRQLNLQQNAGPDEKPVSDVALEIALAAFYEPTRLTRTL